MPHLHENEQKQPKSRAAASSPHFQQEGIASFKPPPFKATADPAPQLKEKEEDAEALQKKENNNNLTGGDAPAIPPNPNEHILTTLQRKYNAYRPEPKQYKRYELPTQQKAVQQRKQIKPFQLKDSPAYQRSQGGLPQEVQAKMENSMGHDFSNVNIHKDSSNATDAGALAYAQGNDVHFAPGQFKPDTTSGQELIGHELAHVVQKREGRVKPTKVLGKGMAVNDDPGLEREADEMGRKAAQLKVKEGDSSIKAKSNKTTKGSTIQRKLILTGDANNITRVIAVMNAGLSPLYTASLDPNGEIQIRSSGFAGPPTRENQLFTTRLQSIVNEGGTVTAGVTSGGLPIVGSYNLEQIDIADIEALGIGQVGWDSRAALLHELIEQREKQLGATATQRGYGTATTGAHGQGLAAELGMIGASLESDTGLVGASQNPDGTMNGTRTVIFRYPSGMRYRVAVTLVSNNISNVTRTELS